MRVSPAPVEARPVAEFLAFAETEALALAVARAGAEAEPVVVEVEGVAVTAGMGTSGTVVGTKTRFTM